MELLEWENGYNLRIYIEVGPVIVYDVLVADRAVEVQTYALALDDASRAEIHRKMLLPNPVPVNEIDERQ